MATSSPAVTVISSGSNSKDVASTSMRRAPWRDGGGLVVAVHAAHVVVHLTGHGAHRCVGGGVVVAAGGEDQGEGEQGQQQQQ